MATFTSDKATSGIQPRFLEVGNYSVVATYTASATFSAGDIIQMVKVPKYAVVVDAKISHNNLAGSGATIELGDGVDVDRYLDATAANAAALVEGFQQNEGVGYEYTATDTVDIRINAVGSAPTSAGQLKLILTMQVDAATR